MFEVPGRSGRPHEKESHGWSTVLTLTIIPFQGHTRASTRQAKKTKKRDGWSVVHHKTTKLMPLAALPRGDRRDGVADRPGAAGVASQGMVGGKGRMSSTAI